MKRMYAYIFTLFIVAAYCLAWFSNDRWIERDEIFNIKLGMDKRDTIAALYKYGITEVLPLPPIDIKINARNINQIHDLRNIDGICVNDAKLDRSIHREFNSALQVVRIVEPTVRKFAEFSHIKTKDEFLSILEPILSRNSGITAFSCIVGSKWAKISESSQDDKNFLLEYDSWIFLEPNGYSQIKLFFKSNKLSQIKYRKQKNEQ